MLELNKVLLTGRLTSDPRYHATDTFAVADLRLAVNRTKREATGETREETLFIDVAVFGKQAEFCKNYLSKGRAIYVEGRLRQESYADNGAKTQISVLAERVCFIEPKPQAAA